MLEGCCDYILFGVERAGVAAGIAVRGVAGMKGSNCDKIGERYILII